MYSAASEDSDISDGEQLSPSKRVFSSSEDEGVVTGRDTLTDENPAAGGGEVISDTTHVSLGQQNQQKSKVNY